MTAPPQARPLSTALLPRSRRLHPVKAAGDLLRVRHPWLRGRELLAVRERQPMPLPLLSRCHACWLPHLIPHQQQQQQQLAQMILLPCIKVTLTVNKAPCKARSLTPPLPRTGRVTGVDDACQSLSTVSAHAATTPTTSAPLANGAKGAGPSTSSEPCPGPAPPTFTNAEQAILDAAARLAQLMQQYLQNRT